MTPGLIEGGGMEFGYAGTVGGGSMGGGATPIVPYPGGGGGIWAKTLSREAKPALAKRNTHKERFIELVENC